MTSKEALKNIKDNYPLIHPTSYKLIKESYDTLEELIEKAQKQEKLLKLYRKLMTIKDELISLAWFDDECDETEEIETDLEKQIKELENNE